MGQYKRKLSRGEKWFYSGQHLGVKYFSRAIYDGKKECARAERDKLKEIEDEVKNPKKDLTMLQLCNERLDYLLLKKSLDYYEENQRSFEKALDEWGRSLPASQVTKGMVNKLLMKDAERLKKGNYTNHKVNALLRHLKALFNYGINYLDLTIKNPCVGLEFYPIDVNLKYIPSEADIEAVKALCNPRQCFLIDFIDQTACRANEALRLTGEHIGKDYLTLWTRKSKNSNLTPRIIPKPDCIDGKEFEGRVFAEWAVRPRFIEEAIDQLPEMPRWNFHNLRHRRASIWANSGMSIYEIMQRLGHQNMAVTMRYLQLLGFTSLKSG